MSGRVNEVDVIVITPLLGHYHIYTRNDIHNFIMNIIEYVIMHVAGVDCTTK